MKTAADNASPRTNSGALILPPPGASPVPGAGSQPALEIRGIKPPVDIPNYWPWIWMAIGTIAFFTWFLWRRKKRGPQTPRIPIIPPHRKARESLRNALQLLSDPYAFCSLVSDTTRIYLEDRFLLKAPERTTEEFLAELAQSPVLDEHQKRSLEQFLSACDLVKFARHEPAEPELRELLEAALRLVDETQPRDGLPMEGGAA